MGTGSLDPAVNRLLIENDLIEEHHWLPQDVANIPYDKLQKYFIIRNAKQEARSAATQVEQFKQEQAAKVGAGRGQTKRRKRR